jgi:hypothetical protein
MPTLRGGVGCNSNESLTCAIHVINIVKYPCF